MLHAVVLSRTVTGREEPDDADQERRRVLQVALNGDAEHPAMPRAADEIAADAAACVAEGATFLHFHAFDEDGRETFDQRAVATALRAVRARCPGVPISMTTFGDIEPDPRRRLDLINRWQVLPDIIPANQGEEGIEELSELLARRGVGIEACVLSVADAEAFVRRGDHSRFVQLVVEALDPDPEQALADMLDMEEVLDRADVRLARVEHGYQAGTWPLLARAARLGHGVRVGIEDVGVLPDGSPAADNAALVRAAAQHLDADA